MSGSLISFGLAGDSITVYIGEENTTLKLTFFLHTSGKTDNFSRTGQLDIISELFVYFIITFQKKIGGNSKIM